MKITDKAMQGTPTQADQWLVESFGRGHGALIGRITPAGSRAFYFRYAGTKGQVRLPIGPFGAKGDGNTAFTVAQARSLAMGWAALYRGGIKDLREHLEQQQAIRQQQQATELREQEQDRQAAELEQKRRVTIRHLFDRWRDLELKSRTLPNGERTGRKDSGALALAQFERHVFAHIGDMTAKDVTRADILRVIDAQLTEGKQRTAQMLFADMKQMFGFGLDRELIAVDPMATLKKSRIVGTGTERDRILSADEVRKLSDALPRANMNPRSVCAVWLILATGCRIGELMGATWADAETDHTVLQAVADVEGVKLGFVDLQARLWHLPDTKSGRDHTIHLSAFAVCQFERLHDLRESCAWVFPSTAGTGPVCVKSFAKQLSDRQRTDEERMSNRSKSVDALALPGGRWTPHDLRRTAASLMAGLGISGDVIDECLNHQIESRVRRTYIRDRREADQVRAFDALGDRLLELVEQTAPASNVTRLRAA
ncbi:tyrosine-type recombinase/integrase [Sphaerotilus sp.]|uniref:tyrosine-type recombinase/integrase n=1 Tax=Sphaerotilus sp. TaxID=2093942 RepID=UPI00286E7495|nr:tyrosine-type recombinase/integrase [Sphaerotilus sp.]